MDSTRGMLENRIESCFNNMDNYEANAKEKESIVRELAELYKLKIEEDKNGWDYDEKFAKRKMEEEQAILDRELKEREIKLKENQSKLDNEFKVKELNFQERDVTIKEDQSRGQSMDRWINVGLQVGLTLIGIWSYDVWYNRGLKFEETGTITAPMTKNLLSRMMPKH